MSRTRRLARSGAARAIREEAGLSLREVARMINVQPSSLSRWETQGVAPRWTHALRWAEILETLGGPG